MSIQSPNWVRPNWVLCLTGHPTRRQCGALFFAQCPTLLDSRWLRQFNARVTFDKLTIIGAGLLGGSIGLAARARGLAKRVSALVRRPESLTECQALGIANEVTLDPAEAVAGADLVVLCTPISGLTGLTKRTLPDLKPGTVVTDVGSTKKQLVAELTPLCAAAGARFVGSHPMAGSHLQGLANANPSLYQGAHCAITPHADCPEQSTAIIGEMWQAAGCSVHRYDPQDHDQAVAEVSHLPHILSSAAAMALSDRGLPLAATGYRDTTRVAAGNAALWREILLQNKDAAAYQLKCSISDLHRLLSAIEAEDESSIESWLQEGCDARAKFDKR